MKLTLGEKLKDERTKRKMTSKQVCEDIKQKYGYNLSLGKYNEMESDVDKDFGYKAFIYLAKFFEVSTDYLLGITENPSVDPDIQNACNITGLNKQSIIKISELDYENKVTLDYLFLFKETEEILEFLKRILITVKDKNVFNFIYSDIWNVLENDPEIAHLDHMCTYFICCNYFNYPYSPLQEVDNIFYEEEIDLNHFKATKLLSEIVNQTTKKTINKKDKEKIIRELEIFFQNDFDNDQRVIQNAEKESTDKEVIKRIPRMKNKYINRKKSVERLIALLKSTL